MATSDSVNTNSVGSFYFTISWNRTGYSSANNEHYIYYEVVAHNTPGNYRTVYTKSLTVNGVTRYYETSGVKYYDGNIVTSGNITISSSNDAGDGSLSISFEAGVGISPGTNCSRSDSWSLDRIPRQANILTAPNFNDEQNPTITYSNPAGNSVDSLQACISLTGSSADISYRNISKTGSSYTFNLTTAERNVLRNATTGNSRTVIFYVKTVISGTTFYSTLSRTFSIINGNPTFTNFEYRDTGDISTQLTGDNQIIINDFNDVKIKISVANKAIANKSATMVKYRVVCGSLSDEKNYSSSADVELNLINIKSKTITVYAIDSRGNSKAVSITIDAFNWKNYINATMDSAEIKRQNGVGTTTTLKFNGKIWKTNDEYDFGAVENSIIECNYKYKQTNEEQFGNPISITPTVDNDGNYTFNSTIVGDLGANGFSLENSYNIQIVLKDATTRQVVYNLILGAGTPAIAIHRDGVSFGKPYDTNEGGPLQVYGKSINTYSSNEIRIGTWIDGKPLYRKVVSFGALPNATTKQVAHNITNIDFITNYIILAKNPTYKYYLSIPATNPANNIYSASGYIDNTNIVIATGDNKTGYTTCYVVIEYTKTTD